MRDYYEQLWDRLPDELDPPDLSLRREFMLANVAPGDRVLDLGCGQGDLTADLAAAGALVTGVEIAEAALRRARARHPGIEFRRSELDGALPIATGACDVVWSSEVIEHVADTEVWLREIQRVLVPGGRLLITTPSHGRLRLAVGGIDRYSEPLGDHLHLYSPHSLRAVLAAFQFGEVEVRTAGGPPLWRRLLLARARR